MVRPRPTSEIRRPGDLDTTWLTAILGAPVAGATVQQAGLAMRELPALHAPVWEDNRLAQAGWLNQGNALDQALVGGLLEGFMARYGNRVASEHRALVAYFLGGGLSIDDRRAHEEALVREYHQGLLARAMRGFDWSRCWSQYRRQAFWGIVLDVAAAMLVVQTERGDEMFMTMLARHAQHVLDLESERLLDDD